MRIPRIVPIAALLLTLTLVGAGRAGAQISGCRQAFVSAAAPRPTGTVEELRATATAQPLRPLLSNGILAQAISVAYGQLISVHQKKIGVRKFNPELEVRDLATGNTRSTPLDFTGVGAGPTRSVF